MAVAKQPIEFKRSPSKWLDLESACAFLKDEYDKTTNVNELLYAGSQGGLNIVALFPQGQHDSSVSISAGWDNESKEIELALEYIKLTPDQVYEISKYYPAENCYQIDIGNTTITTHKLLRISSWDLHDLFATSKGRPKTITEDQKAKINNLLSKGNTYQEVSEKTGIKKGTIKSYVSRSKKSKKTIGLSGITRYIIK